MTRLRRFGAACVVLGFGLASDAAAQEIRAQGQITVARIVVDAHVVEPDGTPVEGLTPDDFNARIDGRPARIEAVDWVEAGEEPVETELVQEGSSSIQVPVSAPSGRLLVFFVQASLHPSRVRGQVRTNHYAMQFLEMLKPEDRVAVVSFDSHLKLRQDFTTDRDKVRKALQDAVRYGDSPISPIVPEPSLASRLSLKAMKDCGSAEEGLYLVGSALRPIDGPKTMLLFGYGLGRLTSMGVSMTRNYTLARRALEQSRTSVFALDTSDADFHSLEVGLQKVAEDTGGFYAKTHMFPRLAIKKLERVIRGHYVITLEKPEGLGAGVHEVELTLRGRRDVSVLAPTTVRD